MGSGPYLSPRILQLVGLALLIGSAIFWAYTSRESVLLMSAAMSLIGLGAYRGAVENLKEAAASALKPSEERQEKPKQE